MSQAVSRWLLSAILLLTLSRCQGPDSTKVISISKSSIFQTDKSIEPLANNTNAQYLQYQSAADEEKATYRHRLVRYMLKDYQHIHAKKLLSQTQTKDLSDTSSMQYHILQTHMALTKQQAFLARKHLQKAISFDHDKVLEENSYYHLLQATLAKQQGNYKNIASHLSQAIHYDDNDVMKKTLTELYWIELNDPKNRLYQVLTTLKDPISMGWVQLRNLLHHSNSPLYDDPGFIMSKIETWKKTFPTHPASILLSTTETTPKPIEQIGVLLPTSGKTLAISSAIQNGIYAAYYNQKTDRTSLEVINTQEDLVKAYRLSEDLSIDANIGPLLKEDIINLEKLTLTIPTLCLNTGSGISKENLQTYSIATTYESNQLASYIRSKGLKKAIVVYDNSVAHKKTFENFQQHFTQDGGEVVQAITTDGNINAKIKNLMGIQSSQQRYQRVANWVKEKVRFTPLRRQDFDHLVIITSHDKARQINPILHYHFAENLPIFSFSSIRSNLTNIQADKDLDGILFFDHPSLSTSPQGRLGLRIQHDIYEHNTLDFMRYNRYIALGIDAYLITKLQYIWDIMPSYHVDGAGAVLYKDQTNHIQRLLEPMQYKQGRVKLVTNNFYNNSFWQQALHKSL